MQREALEEQYRALAELERRHREAPLLFYRKMIEKHPKQRAFLEAGLTHRKRLVLGGNRSGKTWVGRAETLAHLYGFRYYQVPDLKLGPDGDLPSREQVPSKYWTRRVDGIPTRVPAVGMVVSGLPRLRGIGQTIYPGLVEALPEAVRGSRKFHALRGAQGVPDWMELPNGSRLIFASGEQDDLTFEGFTLDFAHVDEPVRQSVYTALLMRLFDFNGPVWLTLTPLGAQSAWMLPMVEDPPADTFVVQVSMRDNPANTADKIKVVEDDPEMDDREKQARLHGRFETLADRVFEHFDSAVHVVPAFDPPLSWIRGMTADPHHRRPPFLLWWAFNPATGEYHFYREYPEGGQFHKARGGGLAPPDIAALIRGVEGAHPVQHRIVDPRFGKAEHLRHGYVEAAWVDLMARCGLYFDAQVPNTGDIERGHAAIQNLLRYDRKFAVGPSNRPKLFVHDRCENLILSFMRYAYTDVEAPVKGIFRKVSEEFKDALDCVRYTVLWPIPATDADFEALQPFTARDLAAANDY